MLRRLTSARALHTVLIAAAIVVSLTPMYAQSAKVLVQTGNVSFIKDASGYTFALMDKTEIKPGYTIKTGDDGYAKIQVPDGSTFEVFSKSEVVYTKTDSIKDLLNVWLGRVKIMIQHMPGVPNPNTVTTPTALISVRGTQFDVSVEDLDGTTLVSLDEGSVVVKHRLQPGNSVELAPGQALRIYPNQPLARVSDRAGLYKFFKRAIQDYLYTRPGSVPGSGGGNIPTSTGKQGDNGTGKTTGTGTGSPTAPGTGSAPTPPPPPPGGGGGGD